MKSYYTKKLNEIPPYTHRLTYLSEKTGLEENFSEEQKNTIDELEPLNIEARYPKYKQEIFKMMIQEKSLYILQKTEELQKWIKQKL